MCRLIIARTDLDVEHHEGMPDCDFPFLSPARRPWLTGATRTLERLHSMWAFAVVAVILLISSTSVRHAEAQVLTGVVLDSASAAPVVGASVSQVRGSEVLGRAGTGSNGGFSLPLQGDPPFDLLFDRLGYEPRRLRILSLSPADRLEVRLFARPVLLSGVSVDAGRDPVDFWWHQVYRFTDDGMYIRGDPASGCYFFALDSVVIRDPLLFLPEAEEYTPAGLFFRGPPAGRGYRDNAEIPDARLRRDAWPCAAMILLHNADYDGYYDIAGVGPRVLLPERGPPDPDAPQYDLVATADVRLPVESVQIGNTIPAAVSTDGIVAVASGTRPMLTLIDTGAADPDAVRVDSLDLAAGPTSLQQITHVGWIGDTLWASDAGQRRVALLPQGEPIVRGPLVPTISGRAPVLGASGDAFDPDLLAPIPIAGGAWFTVQAEPAAPFPPRMEDEPARRRLVTLDPDGGLDRVIAILRPGPWRLDIAVQGTPVEPFRDHPLYALAPRGDRVTVVERALENAVWLDTYTVTRIGLTGDTVFHVERRPPLIPITDRVFDATVDDIASHPVVVRAFAEVALRDAIVESTVYRPRFHPPVTDVIVGFDGATWLRWPDQREDNVRWDVLDALGRPARVVWVDRRLRIIAAGGETVWGLLHERNGDRLVRYALRRRG